MLLSIVPLAIVQLLKEDCEMMTRSWTAYGHDMEPNIPSRRQALIFSLQVLGQFPGLLSPPPSVVIAANDAASRAATFISNFRNGGDNLSPVSLRNSSARASKFFFE